MAGSCPSRFTGYGIAAIHQVGRGNDDILHAVQRIGQRIGALRYQKGITQQALADMTGLL